MSNNDIQYTDFFICQAFYQILTSPLDELEQKLGSKAHIEIAEHFIRLPPEDFQNSAVMANRIAAYCQQPGNESLQEWWGEIYDILDEDGINKMLKQSLDPGEEADDEPETQRFLTNQSRGICKCIKKWAEDNSAQNNQGHQDDAKSK